LPRACTHQLREILRLCAQDGRHQEGDAADDQVRLATRTLLDAKEARAAVMAAVA